MNETVTHHFDRSELWKKNTVSRARITVLGVKFSKIFLLAENTSYATIIILERADWAFLQLRVKFVYFLRAILSLESLATR